MNDINIITEGLIGIFGDNPLIWGKWLLVFASIIFSIIVRVKFKIDDKIDPNRKLEEKVRRAIELKHIIEAKLVESYVHYDDNNIRTFSGKYEYEINNKKYKYIARFEQQTPRRILHLYYMKNPKKVFTNEEQHYYIFSSFPLILLNFSPLIIGAFMVWILGLAN